MGLFIGQNEKRSELQSKIIADLQEKARATSKQEDETKDSDGEELASTLLENQHETRVAGVVISLLIIVLVIVIVFIATRS